MKTPNRSACRSWIVALTLAVALAMAAVRPAATAASPAASLDEFAWLEGSWQGSLDVGDGHALAEVQYLPPQAGTVVGSFRLSKDDRVLVLELFALREVDGRVEMRIRHFGGDLAPWEDGDPIVLVLEEAAGDRFTFRNHVHDSPRWSWLERRGPDEFHARSEIYAADGEMSEIDIVYRRAPARISTEVP